jgi:hypothetical protein
MNQHFLREAAKVGVGLFAADLLSVWWLGGAGIFPLAILGTTWTESAILPITLFDAAVILLLAHYAWRTHEPIRSPSEKHLLTAAGVLFLIVCLLHLARIAFGWPLILGDFAIPVWLSWFGVAVTAYLSYASFHFAFRRAR